MILLKTNFMILIFVKCMSNDYSLLIVAITLDACLLLKEKCVMRAIRH